MGEKGRVINRVGRTAYAQKCVEYEVNIEKYHY